MSIKAASKPASPMISTICGSAMPPTCVPSARPPSLSIRFTRFSFMLPSLAGLAGKHIAVGRGAGATALQLGRRTRGSEDLTFIHEPFGIFFVAFDLLGQFLDCLGVDLLGLVDQFFARLLIAFDQ